MQKTCVRNKTWREHNEAPLVVSNTRLPGVGGLQQQLPPGQRSSWTHSPRRQRPRRTWTLPWRSHATSSSLNVITPRAATGITFPFAIPGEGISAWPTTATAFGRKRSLVSPRTSPRAATIQPTTATRLAAAAAAATTTAGGRTIDGSGNEGIYRRNAGRLWYQASGRSTTGRTLTSRSRRDGQCVFVRGGKTIV